LLGGGRPGELNRMPTHEVRDITILGAGPAGLFALFYAGMRGATAQIVDALPQPGGQLSALYPEKFIFDVAGFPKVLAKDLVADLVAQAAQFHQPLHCGQRVLGLEEADGLFTLVTETDRYPSRTVIIAAGIGAFSPRRLPQAAALPWYGKGIHDAVLDPHAFRGQRIVIIGGGDSAFDWAHQLEGVAKSITLVHRSDRFRAHQATVDAVMASAAAGRSAVHTFHELADVIGDGGRLSAIDIREIKTKVTKRVDCDAVLPMLGYVSDIGPLVDWGLTIEKEEIVVNQLMETGRPGIWAAGDVNTYAGKLKLIATGFGEAAIAVNQAVHWVYPEKKVNPGHSSNLAIFGQKDD
jgi:thioredoxin reductase